MLRCRMNRIIRLLEAGKESEVYDLISSSKYRKALLALESAGCVKLTKAWGGEIFGICLLDSHAGYQLSRHDVWVNRIFGFVAGIVTAVAAHYIIVLIELWLASR